MMTMTTRSPASPSSSAPRVARNRFPGVCTVCGVRVAPDAGVAVRVDGKFSVLCASHAGGGVSQPPQPPRGPRIRVSLSPSGDQVYFQPAEWLGSGFDRYRGALSGSTTYRKEDRRSEAPLGQLSTLSDRLRVAGFELEVHPDVVSAAQAHDARTQAQVVDARGHARAADELLRASGRSLMPFQAEGVEWLSAMSGAILADEMGLGKTIQVLLAAPAVGGVVVVCPKVAKGVWVREAARWRGDLRVAVLAGRGSFRWPVAGELVVTNYEVLPGDADRAEAVASCPRGVTLVADEGHALKAGRGKSGSARGRAFHALSTVARARGGRSWLVTGSPQLNDDYAEQWNLLGMVGQTGTVFGTYDQFLDLCGGSRGKYGVEWGGPVDASVPERLRRVMLRRVKKQVLPQLPEKVVEVVDVSLDRATLRTLESELAELRAAGVDVLGALERARASSRVRFDEVSRVREVLSRAKLAHALEMIEELEEAGEPVVVGSAHRAAIDVLGSRPGWAAITGDTSDAERRRIADAFQAGELRGIAGTTQAMGVAITLTRAHEMVVIDPMWVPELNRQLEDRIHRIGQTWTCRIRYLRADHAVDHAAFVACQIKDEFVGRTVGAASVVQAPAPVIAMASALALAQGAALPPEETDPAELEALLARIRAARETADVGKIRRESVRRAAAAVVSRGYAVPSRSQGQGSVQGDVQEEGPPRGPESAEERWAAWAVVHLASACDGATTEDGVGFMKSDVALGHSIAASVPHGLSDLEWAVVVRICQHYPRQVGRPGVDTEVDSEGIAEVE